MNAVEAHEAYVPGIKVFVAGLALRGGARYETHVHREHQVLAAAGGSVLVAIGARTWVLSLPFALWIPAGIEHTTWAPRAAAMEGVYIHPAIPSRWAEPTVVGVTGLVRELLDLLRDVELVGPVRERAEGLLLDLLRPVSTDGITLPMPGDPRALEVALRMLDDPAGSGGIEYWGRQVGASARTLSRLFVEETGLSFSEWRRSARMRVALSRLAVGDPVSEVALGSGYSTPSAFIAAFRRTTGQTPGTYFAAEAR